MHAFKMIHACILKVRSHSESSSIAYSRMNTLNSFMAFAAKTKLGDFPSVVGITDFTYML